MTPPTMAPTGVDECDFDLSALPVEESVGSVNSLLATVPLFESWNDGCSLNVLVLSHCTVLKSVCCLFKLVGTIVHPFEFPLDQPDASSSQQK